MRSIVSYAVTIVLSLSVVTNDTAAGTIKVGDIVVAEDGNQLILKIDPTTGSQTLLASLNGRGVHSLEFGPNGTLYFLEHVRRVSKLDILSGRITEISHLGLLGSDQADTLTAGMTLGPSGDIYVTVFTEPYNHIVRIDPITGNQTKFAKGGFINNPLGICLNANGHLLVSSYGNNSVVEIDLIGGTQQLVASKFLAGSPFGLAVASDGTIFVGKENPCCGFPENGQSIQKIELFSHASSTAFSGGLLNQPRGIAIDLDGNIITAQSGGDILKIDRGTGVQTKIASGGSLSNPIDVKIARINIPSDPPPLTIVPSVTLKWPALQGNFFLQSSSSVGENAFWTTVTAPLILRGENITASVETSSSTRYFRLAR